jgi:hypothetical protein
MSSSTGRIQKELSVALKCRFKIHCLISVQLYVLLYWLFTFLSASFFGHRGLARRGVSSVGWACSVGLITSSAISMLPYHKSQDCTAGDISCFVLPS